MSARTYRSEPSSPTYHLIADLDSTSARQPSGTGIPSAGHQGPRLRVELPGTVAAVTEGAATPDGLVYEGLITLTEATRYCPRRRGRKVHVSTVFRWALRAQEELTESLVMNHVALPPCFQQAGLVRTENPVADWWLMLIPDGYAGWEANSRLVGEPLHLMLVQVGADPAYGRHSFNGLIRSRLCFRMHIRGSEWIGVSRMNKPEAAGIVRRLIMRAGGFPGEAHE